MTKDEIEKLKRELCGNGPRSYEQAIMATTIDYLAERGLLGGVPDVKSERQILIEAIDRMGWAEINAFYEEKANGQMYDDAGGFALRCIKRLFGIETRRDEVEEYKNAMRAMLPAAPKHDGGV